MMRSLILLAMCVSIPLLSGDSGVSETTGRERLPLPPLQQESFEFAGLDWPGDSFDAFLQGAFVEIRGYNKGEAEIEIGANPTVILVIRVSEYQPENSPLKQAGRLVTFAVEGKPDWFEMFKGPERSFLLYQVKGVLRGLVPWGC